MSLTTNTEADGSPIPAKLMELPRRLVAWAFLAVGVWYLAYRVTTFNAQAPIFSGLVLGAELFGFMCAALHFFMVWRLTERKPVPVLEGRTVDVFIPTINESLEIVRRTVLTALAMDYAHEVYLLDDGRREEMRAMAAELGCRYITRDNNIDAKAGNLNHALTQSSGEFICLFDADHAPKHNFITRTIGYFADPRVAFVQTPQDFYNLDSYQHRGGPDSGTLWTEQALFFRVIQRGKDWWNAAFFCGSCAIVRRSALEEIGGFASETITEDLHTSIRLHKAGYKSVYVAEPVAFGIAAAQIEPFLTQRIRWGQGAMQVWRKEGFFGGGMSLPQSLCYFASMITYFDGWQKLIMYLAPAIVLLTGLLPVAHLDGRFFIHFVPYLLLTFWAFEEVGRGHGRVNMIEQYNMARFAAFAWSTLGLFFPRLKFKVTSKSLRRRKVATWAHLPQTLVFLINAIAIVGGAALYMHGGLLTPQAFIANAVWASVNLALAFSVLTFTRLRSSYRRKSYRFSIPLVARVDAMGRPVLAAVYDLSSDGLSLTIASNAMRFSSVERIQGTLMLPHGPLDFTAHVQFAPNPGSSGWQRLGCAFEWADAQSKDELERFLYGSDLEVRVQQLQDTIATPLEWLLGRFEKQEITLQRLRGNARLALVRANDGSSAEQSALLLPGEKKEPSLLVTFDALDIRSNFACDILAPDGWRRSAAHLSAIDSGASASLNCYRFDPMG